METCFARCPRSFPSLPHWVPWILVSITCPGVCCAKMLNFRELRGSLGSQPSSILSTMDKAARRLVAFVMLIGQFGRRRVHDQGASIFPQ
ncbi:hypothetical protein C8R48DRAFT_7196 [Suillus tomentosus]|nr:hypothetical protein C8R48DRAFT_7196 [Suillus tomentosus]